MLTLLNVNKASVLCSKKDSLLNFPRNALFRKREENTLKSILTLTVSTMQCQCELRVKRSLRSIIAVSRSVALHTEDKVHRERFDGLD